MREGGRERGSASCCMAVTIIFVDIYTIKLMPFLLLLLLLLHLLHLHLLLLLLLLLLLFRYRIKLHQSLEKQKERRLAKELALKGESDLVIHLYSHATLLYSYLLDDDASVIEREEDGRSKQLLAEMESNLLRSGCKVR